MKYEFLFIKIIPIKEIRLRTNHIDFSIELIFNELLLDFQN